jgi:Ca2+-binding EF-hand superfamily protein
MRPFLLLAALALPAAAADERFDKLDFDRDGRVSLAEAAGNADLVKGFDRADRNRDGKLTRKEYDALLARAAAAESAAAGGTAPKRKKK